MDQGGNNISNYQHNDPNHDEFIKQHENFIPTPEIPEAIDRRAPQLNGANTSCKCNCPCARGAANGAATNSAGGNGGPAMDVSQEGSSSGYQTAHSETSPNYGDESNDHDEGVEPHMIEVGDFGLIPLELIHRTLARHKRCTCHHGLLPMEDDYPFTTFNSPTASGLITPADSASMIAEANSSDQSMVSSQVLSICSRNSSLLPFMEGAYAQVPIFRPLSLTAEVEFMYPVTIDLSGSDFSEYDDIW